MSIPQLSQEMIRRYASSKSWQRGEAYYRDGYVRRVVQRGESMAAEVEGNDIRPYQVSISKAKVDIYLHEGLIDKEIFDIIQA